MPFTVAPQVHVGYQGHLFGAAFGYGYIGVLYPVAAFPNATDGRSSSLGEPVIFNNQALLAEVSFTSRVDRVAIFFSVSGGAMHSRIEHFDLVNYCRKDDPTDNPKGCWRPTLFLAAGVFFDGAIRRQRRAREAAELTENAGE